MFTVRGAQQADTESIVAIINRERAKPLTVEWFKENEAKRPLEEFCHRGVVVNAAGEVVGFGHVISDLYRPAGCLAVFGRVTPEVRRQGAGRALLDYLVAWARYFGATQLETNVDLTDAAMLQAAERLGFRQLAPAIQVRLDLTQWDAARWAGRVGQAKAQGIRFATLADEGVDEATLRRYHAYIQELERDVPGRGPLTPSWEVWCDLVVRETGWDPSGIWLAVDGERWAAVCTMEAQPDGSVYTALSAVDRGYRGRGFALATKVVALAAAQARGAHAATAYNHVGNHAMFATNEALGYQRVYGVHNLYLPLQHHLPQT